MTSSNILSQGGLLSQHITGYEPRPQQIEMADLVERCIASNRHAIIEAGTGTGKSFAYLIPAILSDKQAVVTTANKTLQAQLVRKDLPALQEVLGVGFDFAIAKGKGNYLCLAKLKDAHPATNAIGRWLEETADGDIDNAPRPLMADERERLCAGDDCARDKCKHFGQCYYYAAKRARLTARVVVTNHALLCQHLLYPEAELLPAAPVLIVDEAHQLESYAVGIRSDEISPWSFRGPAKELHTEAGEALEALATQMLNGLTQDAMVHPQIVWGPGMALAGRLVDLAADLEPEPALDRYEAARNEAKCAALRQELVNLSDRLIRFSRPTPDGVVRHVTRRIDETPLAKTTQYDVGEFLGELGEMFQSIVYTSATLANGPGDFGYFQSRVGIEDAETLQVGSPFDYAQQCLLYLPRAVRMPTPNNGTRDRFDEMARIAAKLLIEASEGGALCLYTSYRSMNAAAEYLTAETAFPVRRQGELGRAELIDWLKRTPNGVLCATASFWEGIDISGDALRLVIIDKLPFAAPGPVEHARQRAMGERAFLELSVPEATLKLKQGFGRLIRSKSDYGVVAILDPRLWSSPYGARIYHALPKARLVEKVDEVKAFYRRHSEASQEVSRDERRDARPEIVRRQTGRAAMFRA